MPEQALSDIRVLDLGHYIAGPYCGKLLADYGADVVKVERPRGGDPARRMGPFPGDVPHHEKSGLFLHINTNKRSVTLNLKTATGRRILLDLVKTADILIENFEPRVMPSLGLSYDELAQVNPRLIMVSISNFGQTGPYRDYKGTELLAFALTSRMHLHGAPERPPLRYGPDIAQFQAGSSAATATMGALFGARRFGIGQQIDLSVVECMIGNVDVRLLLHSYDGAKGTRVGGAKPGFHGAYPCKDGFVMFAVGGERFFRRLLSAMGREDLLQDPRFNTVSARVEHQDEWEAIFLTWLSERTRREIFATCQAHGVMCAPIQTIDEVFTDPQNIARRFFTEIDHPEAGRLTYPGAPMRLTETPWQVRRPAPRLGEHNVEIFCDELGYSRRDLVRLRAAGVI